MATNLLRFETDGQPRWGVVSGTQVAPLSGAYATTAALIEQGEMDWRVARIGSAAMDIGDVKILSPVTTPCRIYCQGANYRQHMIESGLDPDSCSMRPVQLQMQQQQMASSNPRLRSSPYNSQPAACMSSLH